MSATTTTAQPPLTPRQQHRQTFLLAYEKRTDLALSALALVYLITFSIQSIWYRPQDEWYGWLVAFGNILWLLFALDLLFRFIVAPVKRHFFRRNWLDTVTVVIPQFKALRALRAFTPDGILAHAQSKGVISVGAAASGAISALLVVWIGSLMVLDAERGAPGADIEDLEDAVWWSFETITTVGYGDFVPVTGVGRFFAILIMLVGISVLGAVTATLSATLVKSRGSASPSSTASDSPPSVDPDLQKELAEIKSMLASIQQRLDGNPPTA